MDEFSTTLHHRRIVLLNASDILRFSFIVQKSIYHLDLKTSQKLMVLDCMDFPWCGEISWHCPFKRANYFINSEEKCHKYFTPSRSLLFSLHLDLPRGREPHLISGPNHVNRGYCKNNPYIAEIITSSGLYDTMLYNFIAETNDVNSEKRILKWILKRSLSKISLLSNLPTGIARKCIDFFYPVVTIPELFKNFIQHLDIIGWITKGEDPEILEFLLHYARKFGRIILKGEEECGNIIHMCIFKHLFKSVSPILKYMNAPKFDAVKYVQYSNDLVLMRPDLDYDDFDEEKNFVERERKYLIVQVVWMYFRGHLYYGDDATSEALHLIWCSIPDPYLSFKEIRIFEKGLSAQELENIYDFYTTAIGEFYERVEPRSLQHFCRTVIRRTLRENHHWIPEGIRKMGVAKPFQTFLNLEKTIVTCELNELESTFQRT